MKNNEKAEMKKPAELTEEALEKAAGGTEEFFEKRMLERGGKTYAKDLLENVAPGASAVIPIIFASAEDATV